MTSTGLLVATITIDAAVAPKGAAWLAGSGAPYASVDALDLPDAVLTRVFDLYKASYGHLAAQQPGTPTFNIQDPRALLEYDRFVLITDTDSKIVGFALAKTTAYGVKVCAMGQDGSPRVKAAIIAFHIDALNTEGVYAEVSPPLETKLNGHVPSVSAAEASKILKSKVLVIDSDSVHYMREITNVGPKRKKMVGKPHFATAKVTSKRR